ncbi:MAG: alpha/beta hydrolase [Labedaea sp.]
MGKPEVSRRRVLFGGLGLGLVGVTAGAGVLPNAPTLRRAESPTVSVPDVPRGPYVLDRVYSPARGQYVDLLVMRPAGVTDAALPVCLVLHGRGGTARGYLQFGLPQFLTAATGAGVPPFSAVAVDCGRGYYMDRGGDDPMRMLIEEVPRWLDERGHAAPAAALGFSMGGWGALYYARRRHDLKAVALASPAMFQRWSDAESRKSFVDRQQWQAYEPLRHTDDIAGTPVGLWCGTEDSFAPAAREFTAKFHPELSAITRGAHNSPYWLRVLPDIMRFIGLHLTPN